MLCLYDIFRWNWRKGNIFMTDDMRKEVPKLFLSSKI